MKMRPLSMFALLIGAMMIAATLTSCAAQTQTCAAYQQVNSAAGDAPAHR